MLTETFRKELSESPPERRLTGVVTWRQAVRHARAASDPAAALMAIKQRFLSAASEMPEARINPLAGLAQAIVDAPVRSWQLLIEREQTLIDDVDTVIEANLRFFEAPPPGLTDPVPKTSPNKK